jgi:4-diphosphocytidyl-2C-methyl-D-erythritol kinase
MADGFVPPQGVISNAKRGLELRREFNRGGTEVGVARARSLSNGQSIPLETIRRMVSYFARHEVDKKGEDWGNTSNPSAGYIAWLLWGGDAGKTWADSISEREKKKDKSMNLDTTSAFAKIIKQEKLEDGTLMVYGKATDDSLDIDEQICDAGWLSTAMPQWFKTGGNVREQHSNIAAGVAKELDAKADGFYINVHVVDPVSVKKTETGVFKGFSIGIRSPRIVRDSKAANGRIIDGQIVEVSLVDRPANPNAKLIMAKSVGTEIIKVEELVEATEEVVETPAETATQEVVETVEATEEKSAHKEYSKEEALKRLQELTKEMTDLTMMCKELGYIEDKAEDEEAVGESAEEETAEGSNVGAETAEEEVDEAEGKKPLGKAGEVTKCLECGCNQPANSHGATQLPNGDNVTTAVMISPNETAKSVDTIIPDTTIERLPSVKDEDVYEDSEEDSEKSALSDEVITDIIAKAVKSATDSVTNEINSYKEEISKLQDDLATAKTKAVGSGPKRFAVKEKTVEEISHFLSIAADYRAKSASATDKELARGYKELAQDFEAKAKAIKAN